VREGRLPENWAGVNDERQVFGERY
jgi:hypothetical protein